MCLDCEEFGVVGEVDLELLGKQIWLLLEVGLMFWEVDLELLLGSGFDVLESGFEIVAWKWNFGLNEGWQNGFSFFAG